MVSWPYSPKQSTSSTQREVPYFWGSTWRRDSPIMTSSSEFWTLGFGRIVRASTTLECPWSRLTGKGRVRSAEASQSDTATGRSSETECSTRGTNLPPEKSTPNTSTNRRETKTVMGSTHRSHRRRLSCQGSEPSGLCVRNC
ncbi:hypothetical protein PanWU01x14_333030 [Parasponia andersonii]|uniref:Uncharacterized protein n=1 Tax=Parasponia andersonii TaxID=3476 RepID=A0A2P5AH38_PARAD|nr:hypothetical protein PanWU01x14_333030 [Parasponia andersonii]